MLKITFIILHYENIEDTLNCIGSIQTLENKTNMKINIIIVDNKSPNGSGIDLQNKYKNDETIEILLLDKNYGFSKANNEAYQRAQQYNSDIILVLNNDIIFENKNFLDELEKIYNLPKKYDIICPDIINAQDQHQNPLREKELSLCKAYKNMLYEMFFSLLINIPVVRTLIVKLRDKREQRWFAKYYSDKNININANTEYFVPFGAFIIYMNKWLEKEKLAFVSDTFMYEEEDMLALYIQQKHYNILYAPELKVRHLEGQSTEKSNKNRYKILKFKSRNKAIAIRQYIKFYKKISKEGLK